MCLLLASANHSYTENPVSEAEFAALPPRLQEQVKRAAAAHNQSSWNQYYTPQQMPNRFRRIGRFNLHFVSCFLSLIQAGLVVDWLREKVFFDGLRKRDDYAIQRLGYKAPNIFVVQLQI